MKTQHTGDSEERPRSWKARFYDEHGHLMHSRNLALHTKESAEQRASEILKEIGAESCAVEEI